MNKSDILHLETRRRIFNYILDNPGLHMHELARNLHIKYQNLCYHVKHLEKHDMIIVKSKNFYSRIYAKDKMGKERKELFDLIRQETPRNILLAIIYQVACSQKDLSEMLEKHPSTIKYHLKKLLDLDLIEPATVKDGVTYTNLPDCEYITRIPNVNETWYVLKNPSLVILSFWYYRKSFSKDKIFKTVFNKYVEGHRFSKKYIKEKGKGQDFYVNLYLEILYDIFPHPYHV